VSITDSERFLPASCLIPWRSDRFTPLDHQKQGAPSPGPTWTVGEEQAKEPLLRIDPSATARHAQGSQAQITKELDWGYLSDGRSLRGARCGAGTAVVVGQNDSWCLALLVAALASWWFVRPWRMRPLLAAYTSRTSSPPMRPTNTRTSDQPAGRGGRRTGSQQLS